MRRELISTGRSTADFRGALFDIAAKLAALATDDAERDAAEQGYSVEELIALRRRRNTVFGDDLFADPSWDILLDLYLNRRMNISVSSACLAAGAPPTTALRHLVILISRGLVTKHPDPDDRRRSYVRLSNDAIAGMKRVLAIDTGHRE